MQAGGCGWCNALPEKPVLSEGSAGGRPPVGAKVQPESFGFSEGLGLGISVGFILGLRVDAED